MNITTIARLDQLVPISKARSNLPTLVEEVTESKFFVLAKKYQPKAALIDLGFLEKLLEVYRAWQREQDFAELDKLRSSLPTYKLSQVEKDIVNTLHAIREAA